MNRVTRRLVGRDTGWAGPGLLGMLTLGAFALISIAAAAPEGTPTTMKVAHIASVQLADDDGGQAMFANRALAPGRSVSRCLKVGYSGSAGQGAVRLAATDLTGALAGSLNVTAAVGTGGDFASCAGFAGTTFYTGSLAGLAGSGAPPGTATGWSPTGTDSRTFQITVTLPDDNALQGVASHGNFEWLLIGDPAPEPTAPAAPAVQPAEPVAVVPTPASTDTVDGTPVPSAPATPAGTPSRPGAFGQAPGDVSAAGTGRADGSSGGKSVSSAAQSTWSGLTSIASNLAPKQLAKNLHEVAKNSVVVAKRVARQHSELPAMSVVALGSFLVLQGRIDRKDPKLALAPLWGDGDLPFEDPDLAFADPEDLDYKTAAEDEDR